MAIGAAIRRMFGPHERQISEAYRSIYVNVDAFVAGLREWVPEPRRILEVGCGEGAVSERLAVAFPNAEIVGIDITPAVGRLYGGPDGRVRFAQCTVEEFRASENPGTFDLIVLADVLHHVPLAFRQSILETIKALLAPTGQLIFKEWERTTTPIHWLGYLSDRWLTGDRIHYLSRAEMREQIGLTFGEAAIVAERRVRPWRNNLAMLVRP